MKKTTIKEYDKEGKLIKETVVEEDDSGAKIEPIPYLPYAPIYPQYPIVPTYIGDPPYKYDYTITCANKKG